MNTLEEAFEGSRFILGSGNVWVIQLKIIDRRGNNQFFSGWIVQWLK